MLDIQKFKKKSISCICNNLVIALQIDIGVVGQRCTNWIKQTKDEFKRTDNLLSTRQLNNKLSAK